MNTSLLLTPVIGVFEPRKKICKAEAFRLMSSLDPVSVYARYEGTIVNPVPSVDGQLTIYATQLLFSSAVIEMMIPLERVVKTDVIRDEENKLKLRVMFRDSDDFLRSAIFDLLLDPRGVAGQITLLKNRLTQETINASSRDRPSPRVSQIRLE